MFDRLERPGLGETLTENARTDAKLHRELGSLVGDGRRTRLMRSLVDIRGSM